MRRVPRHSLWVAVTVVSFVLHATWGALDYSFYSQVADRRADQRALACSLADYFQTISEVVAVRHAPGDERIGPATTDVINAALAIGGPCPEEE